MRTFFTPQRTWPPGVTRPHVYVLPDLATDGELADLVRRARLLLNQVPALALTDDDWLHATVQRVDGVHGADLTPTQRDELAVALRDELAVVPRFRLACGPALAGDSGVVLDLDGDLPGQPWTALTDCVRAAITAVLGPAAVASHPGPPHVSLGYATADADSGALQSRLRRQVRPARAGFTVAAVHLVDVEQAPASGTYRWQTWDRIDLLHPDVGSRRETNAPAGLANQPL